MKIGIYFPANRILIPFEVREVHTYRISLHKIVDAVEGTEIKLPFEGFTSDKNKHVKDIRLGFYWNDRIHTRDIFYLEDVNTLTVIDCEFKPSIIRTYISYPTGSPYFTDVWKNKRITNFNDLEDLTHITYRGIFQIPIIPRTSIFFCFINTIGISNLLLKANLLVTVFKGNYIKEEKVSPIELNYIYQAPLNANIFACGEFIGNVLKSTEDEIRSSFTVTEPIPPIKPSKVSEEIEVSGSVTTSDSTSYLSLSCEYGSFYNNTILIDRDLQVVLNNLIVYATNYPIRITCEIYDLEDNLLVEIPIVKIDSTGNIIYNLTIPIVLTGKLPIVRKLKFKVYNDTGSSITISFKASLVIQE